MFIRGSVICGVMPVFFLIATHCLALKFSCCEHNSAKYSRFPFRSKWRRASYWFIDWLIPLRNERENTWYLPVTFPQEYIKNNFPLDKWTHEAWSFHCSFHRTAECGFTQLHWGGGGWESLPVLPVLVTWLGLKARWIHAHLFPALTCGWKQQLGVMPWKPSKQINKTNKQNTFISATCTASLGRKYWSF